MSAPASFHRRIVGRASSPPTWACYEQIVDSFDDEDDDDEYTDSASEIGDSCSEDGEDYHRTTGAPVGESHSDSDESDRERHDDSDHAHGMDIDDDEEESAGNHVNEKEAVSDANKKDVKGKQRAVEPEPESPRSRKSRRHRRGHVETLRPILTIHRSQGFVWNQDLFVPPYIKDRYITSTSPPNCKGLLSGSINSSSSAMTDYEVEVVDILVREGELNDIIP